ncbi:YybH family protein [Paludibaculum fermentans]|uniref:Nuclear transport factor 2 family protein n=1 Tax=Paludibaculum fermentans TaxID=1473598 RepID=A0A7S7SMQ5_PALFE|nr:nuclear transport factor 2 family protein [Paludibaculum fermentans]QOY90669.1 nuclear transport factor 2 family protein [Paludibaculum fermentans]
MTTPSRLMRSLTLASLLWSLPMTAQNELHQEDRQALLKILNEIEKAINAQDIEGMIAQMRPDCTVTWWNAEVSRGHDEIRAYYRKMVKDPGRYITKYTTRAKLGEHALFLGSGGDVAVADGSMEDEFFPVIRGPFRLNSRWSTTVAKTGGEWKVASLHLSSNVFTNQLITELTRALWYAGGAGLLIGGLAGWLLGRRGRQRLNP